MEPLSKQVRQAFDAGDLDAAHRYARLQTIASRVELAVLFLVVFDMALKPTFADHGAIAYGLGGFGIAMLAVVARGLPRRAPAPQPALDAA